MVASLTSIPTIWPDASSRTRSISRVWFASRRWWAVTDSVASFTRGRHRESTESWADLLRSCKRRGRKAPVLVVGDGALGFWAAVREVFPQTREQACWFHKIANVLNALPKSAQPGVRTALAEIWNAEDKEHATTAAKAFASDYGVKWPKSAAKITDDLDVLLTFYDYPAEHWVHLHEQVRGRLSPGNITLVKELADQPEVTATAAQGSSFPGCTTCAGRATMTSASIGGVPITLMTSRLTASAERQNLLGRV